MTLEEFMRLRAISYAERQYRSFSSRRSQSKRTVRKAVGQGTGRWDLKNGKVFSEIGIEKIFPKHS